MMLAGDPLAIDIAVASSADIEEVQAIDERVLGRAERQDFLRQSVERRECLVARCNGTLTGFAVVDRSFFDQRFVALLIVDPRYQRQGIGSALMTAVESRFPGEKLFTSTNTSNLKMQALCEQLGFVRSGYIEHLDEGDPEIVYFKIAGDPRETDIPDERDSGKS
jgi:ribosomal protein S18 acetylase RimI-like enzyme